MSEGILVNHLDVQDGFQKQLLFQKYLFNLKSLNVVLTSICLLIKNCVFVICLISHYLSSPNVLLGKFVLELKSVMLTSALGPIHNF